VVRSNWQFLLIYVTAIFFTASFDFFKLYDLAKNYRKKTLHHLAVVNLVDYVDICMHQILKTVGIMKYLAQVSR